MWGLGGFEIKLSESKTNILSERVSDRGEMEVRRACP